MKRDRVKKAVVLGTVLTAALAVLVLGYPAFKNLQRARADLQTRKQNLAESRAIRLHISDFTPRANSHLRLRTGAPQVRDALVFEDRVYAATNSGLMIFSRAGAIQDQWTTAEEFPSLDLTSLAVANDALWIGTNGAGLLRKKDDQWTQYLPQETRLRAVHSLLSTKQGTLFAGTEAGVVKYDGKEFTPFYPDRLGKTTVTSLSGDALTLWLGTFHHGLFLFDKGTLQHFGPDEGLMDSLVTDVQAAGSDAYVSTPAGIQVHQNGQFHELWKGAYVASIQVSDSVVWAATLDRGLRRIPLTSARRRGNELRPVVSGPDKTAAILHKVGDSLMAFGAGKAWYLDQGENWKLWHSPAGSLSDANISTMLRSSDGKLWVGYFDKGLDVLDEDFQKIAHIKDDVFFCVNYLSEDRSGNIYVSTANGLAVVKHDGSRKVYRQADGLLSDRVMQAVPIDPEGNRVAIATSQGFSLLEKGTIKSLYAFHGLVNNHVYSIAAGGGQIYLGTLGGISRIQDMHVVSNWTQMDSGLRRNWVNALLTLDNNRLLVGTYGSGIQERSASGDWSGFALLPDDFEVNPNAFFYDGQFVFCGTLDRGAYIFDTRRNAWKQMRDDLPSLNVTAFARAGSFLLVATDRGLLQVSYDKISNIPDLR